MAESKQTMILWNWGGVGTRPVYSLTIYFLEIYCSFNVI